MTWGLRAFFIVFGLFTAYLLYLLITPTFFEQTPQPLGSNPALTQVEKYLPEQGIVYALIIDTRGAATISENKVLSGEDGILFLAIPEKIRIEKEPLYIFNNLSSLAQFDKDQNGAINRSDGIYKYLRLGHLDTRNKRLVIQTLNQAGIAAITINAHHLALELAGKEERHLHNVGEVIYDTGLQRLAVLMPIHTRYLRDVKIENK